jgi:pyruvate-formate lyase
MVRAADKLKLARKHLKRVRTAWPEPTDWDDLFLYGFYCLEAAVTAAALHFNLGTSRMHWEKVDIASKLHKNKGLPDVTELLRDLNDARKAAAYGDIPSPELDAEDIASKIEEYVEAVESILTAGSDDE